MMNELTKMGLALTGIVTLVLWLLSPIVFRWPFSVGRAFCWYALPVLFLGVILVVWGPLQ